MRSVKESALAYIESLRTRFDKYISAHPEFLSTLEPLDLYEDDGSLPDEVAALMNASKIAGTGPMAGIAGLFSEFTGNHILRTFGPNELIIENGGDIFAAIQNEITVSVFAGESPLSEKIGIVLPEGRWGVCTSSGRVGPSLNFGNADALTTVCRSAVIADHLATGFSNQVKSKADINRILDRASLLEEVLFMVIIVNDQLGVKGSLEIVPL